MKFFKLLENLLSNKQTKQIKTKKYDLLPGKIPALKKKNPQTLKTILKNNKNFIIINLLLLNNICSMISVTCITLSLTNLKMQTERPQPWFSC